MAKQEPRNVGGRTIGGWKGRLRQEFPAAFEGDPRSPAQAERIKTMADRVNQWAKEGGYSFTADSAQVMDEAVGACWRYLLKEIGAGRLFTYSNPREKVPRTWPRLAS
jgi:hypothetical protein